MVEDLIDNRINNLKHDLNNGLIPDKAIIRKYLLHGTPLCYSENEDLYFELKNMVADQFNISTTKIVMVGSAKLGFSIAPHKLWKKFDDESDIDIVVISESLYDQYWKELLDFNIDVKARTGTEDSNYRKFLEYFLKGWIRPDLFPFKYSGKEAWFDFFNKISYGKFGNHKIAAAIFRNEYFFEHYHMRNINQLRLTDHE